MDDIRGLKPYLYFAPNWKLILLVIACVAVAGFVISWWLRRKPAADTVAVRPEAAPLAPPRSVLEQLDQLKTSKLIERDRVREFHSRLSAIVRAFLGSRFGLPGRRLTTTELLAELANQPIDPNVFRMIADFLPLCDLAKFADARPSRNEMELRLATAYQLVEMLGDEATPVEESEENEEAARDVVG